MVYHDTMNSPFFNASRGSYINFGVLIKSKGHTRHVCSARLNPVSAAVVWTRGMNVSIRSKSITGNNNINIFSVIIGRPRVITAMFIAYILWICSTAQMTDDGISAAASCARTRMRPQPKRCPHFLSKITDPEPASSALLTPTCSTSACGWR